MAEDLDAIHLRACGCDEWHTDPADAKAVRSLMDHVVTPLLEQLGRATAEIEQYRIQLGAVTRQPCTCDGDPVECSHETARAYAEHKLEAVSDHVVVEHAVMMSGGGMHARNLHPEIERIYPLAEWIRHQLGSGGKVYRREIAVVQDWSEVEATSAVDGGG